MRFYNQIKKERTESDTPGVAGKEISLDAVVVFLLVVFDRNALPHNPVNFELVDDCLHRREYLGQETVERRRDEVCKLDLKRWDARFLPVVLLQGSPA